MRKAFSQAIVQVAEQDPRIILVTGDLGFQVFDEFCERFGDRYINVGVAEAQMITVAAGLALSGKIVYIYSIINFVTLRCLEQINVDIASMNLHVNIAEHLREGKELIVSSEHAFRVVQVLHAARESGASGKSVDVMI